MSAGDRAGKGYWDESWLGKEAPPVNERRSKSIVHGEIAGFLHNWLGGAPKGAGLVEFGCARSIWLPFFSQELGLAVTGVDYSERGCELAREVLAQSSTKGDVVCADFFEPPHDLIGRFDFGVSFGVAEHFDDTAACIASFGRFLSARGRLVTVIPNLMGVPGFVQKHVNRPVYDKHVPLDPAGLAAAHRAAGLHVRSSGHLVSTNFGVLNLDGLPKRTASFLAKRILLAGLGRLSLLAWTFERQGIALPKLSATAGYVYCVADVVRRQA
jgi:SAM-dependent methyltransferase